MRTNDIKALAEENWEEYVKAKRLAFTTLIEGVVESYMDSCDDTNYETDELWMDSDIDFEFPDVFNWIVEQKMTAQEEMNDYHRDEGINNEL